MKYIIPAILAMIATVVFAVICNALIEWRWSWIDEWSFAARGCCCGQHWVFQLALQSGGYHKGHTVVINGVPGLLVREN